jgi:hypothetical protein
MTGAFGLLFAMMARSPVVWSNAGRRVDVRPSAALILVNTAGRQIFLAALRILSTKLSAYSRPNTNSGLEIHESRAYVLTAGGMGRRGAGRQSGARRRITRL